MSATAFIDRCLAAGMPIEVALEAARAFEIECAVAVAAALEGIRSKARDRQAKHRENVTSRHVTSRDKRDKKETFPQTPIQEKIVPPSPPKGGSFPQTTFADFWRAYPNKTGKGAAEKSYTKAVSLISGPDPPGVLLAALERVIPTWREPKFIPHAATWLNQRRWEDEPQTVVTLEPRHERFDTPAAKSAARTANLSEGVAIAHQVADYRGRVAGAR